MEFLTTPNSILTLSTQGVKSFFIFYINQLVFLSIYLEKLQKIFSKKLQKPLQKDGKRCIMNTLGTTDGCRGSPRGSIRVIYADRLGDSLRSIESLFLFF